MITQSFKEEKTQKIFNEFDEYLAEIVTDENDLSRFKNVKMKLRELFIEFELKIGTLQNDVYLLKSWVSILERMESDINAIHMGDMGAQLRNKMIRYIKPNLSKRAARDEQLCSFQKNRIEKAHYEQSMTNDQIDSILNEFLSCNDQYLKEQATLVVRFLKILADHIHELPIVDLG